MTMTFESPDAALRHLAATLQLPEGVTLFEDDGRIASRGATEDGWRVRFVSRATRQYMPWSIPAGWTARELVVLFNAAVADWPKHKRPWPR